MTVQSVRGGVRLGGGLDHLLSYVIGVVVLHR